MATLERDRVPPIDDGAWRPVLSMRWQHLLFVHWRVPPETLRPLIPEPLQIDTYGGYAWVGFVPFVMTHVRPVWLPAIPKLFDFPEANIRTYVRYGEQRGVWFFSLDAAHRFGVWVARRFWRLPYYYARIHWHKPAPDQILYETRRRGRRPAYARVRYAIEGTPKETRPDTLEHFLVERYTLFTLHRNELYRADVVHLPYAIQPARILELEQTLTDAAGIRITEAPAAVFYAPGFGVLASGLQHISVASPMHPR